MEAGRREKTEMVCGTYDRRVRMLSPGRGDKVTSTFSGSSEGRSVTDRVQSWRTEGKHGRLRREVWTRLWGGERELCELPCSSQG